MNKKQDDLFPEAVVRRQFTFRAEVPGDTVPEKTQRMLTWMWNTSGRSEHHKPPYKFRLVEWELVGGTNPHHYTVTVEGSPAAIRLLDKLQVPEYWQ